MGYIFNIDWTGHDVGHGGSSLQINNAAVCIFSVSFMDLFEFWLLIYC
jgi:hypothetical protein